MLRKTKHPNLSVKTRMEKVLKDIDYDFSQFTLPDFIQWLEQREQHEVQCLPFDMPVGLFGCWLTSDHATEYILYDCKSPPMHRNHIILHEICHWLRNHPTYCLTEETLRVASENGNATAMVDLLMPLARKRHACESDRLDEEAEALCSLIQNKVRLHSRFRELMTPTHEHVTSFFDALALSQ